MSPRPMRRYQPPVLVCVRCGKPVDPNREPVEMADGQIRHRVICTAPLARRPKA